MAAEWSTLTLADLGRIVTGKTPSTSIEANFGGDIPFITPSDMDGRRIIGETSRYLTEAGANSVKGARIPRGSVMVSCIGSDMGKSAIAEHDSVTNQQINSIIVDSRFCSEFVYYNLSTRKHEIRHEAAGGSAQPILNKSAFSKLPISLPPLPEQKAIARILGTLDDKIELNRRMNATLEAMARALFQSWFVDFDPVRRNAAAKVKSENGKVKNAPSAPTSHFSLQTSPFDHFFPAGFQDSALGEIPEGWTAEKLPEVIEVNPRRTLSKGAVAPYLDMKNLPMQGHSADDVVNREFGSGTKFRNGDTLLARITPCLENGKTGFVDFLNDGQVGWGSTEYIVLAPKSPLPSEFGYLLARSEKFRTHAIQNMTGTSGRQRVPAECFNAFLLAVPSPEIAKRFGEFVAPIFAKIKSNSDQSRTLATLRDTLLPKMLSGELEVAN